MKTWAEGDPDAFARLSLESMKRHPAVSNSLLRDRNRAWLPAIKRDLKQRNDVLVGMAWAAMVPAPPARR